MGIDREAVVNIEHVCDRPHMMGIDCEAVVNVAWNQTCCFFGSLYRVVGCAGCVSRLVAVVATAYESWMADAVVTGTGCSMDRGRHFVISLGSSH